MNVKELLNVLKYDFSVPYIFVINNKQYYHHNVLTNDSLLNINIVSLKITGKIYELNENDIVKISNKKGVSVNDIELFVPENSNYYMIIITIN